MSIPNLLDFSPVEMWGCVFGSTSGLMRSEIRAFLPMRPARSLMTPNSSEDSTLNMRISERRAKSISSTRLPTPE